MKITRLSHMTTAHHYHRPSHYRSRGLDSQAEPTILRCISDANDTHVQTNHSMATFSVCATARNCGSLSFFCSVPRCFIMSHSGEGPRRTISFLFVAVGIVDVVTKLTQYYIISLCNILCETMVQVGLLYIHISRCNHISTPHRAAQFLNIDISFIQALTSPPTEHSKTSTQLRDMQSFFQSASKCIINKHAAP
jgi:hypothetical protein